MAAPYLRNQDFVPTEPEFNEQRHRERLVGAKAAASDALCKGQLADRSKSLPAGAPWTTEAEFAAITAYFQPPSEDEHFNVVRHERAEVTVDKSPLHSRSQF
ncbi:MAG: hypothetical protein DMG96_16840 [Acidobacteria bacterium]|nr:MAG: hypothetical protein DMG96_16840 [Acidobacteriota bacterium]